MATGTAQKTVVLNSRRSAVILLPLVAEQKRIVARFVGLLSLGEIEMRNRGNSTQ